MTDPTADRSGAGAHSLIADLHCHPSMKTYLFGKKLHTRHRSGKSLDPFALRTDLPTLKDGGVNILLNSIYLLERGLLDDCTIFRTMLAVSPAHWKRLFKGNEFDRAMELIEHFEKRVVASKPVGGVRLAMARTKSELDAVLQAGNIAVLHSVEGGHSLDKNAANVEKFFNVGVCMLTLAHFYENGIAYPVVGVPESMQFLDCFKQKKDLTKGLTAVGHDVVEEMVRLGMLIDMTHCTPVARKEVMDRVQTRRPLVMSHVGVHHLNPDPMNPTDEEITKIADTGGIIGVVFMTHWLAPGHPAKGIRPVVETMQHLRNVGGIDCVGIGTDFDGFTDPPDDLKDHAYIPDVIHVMQENGFTPAEVEQVVGGNAKRVLQEGWGR